MRHARKTIRAHKKPRYSPWPDAAMGEERAGAFSGCKMDFRPAGTRRRLVDEEKQKEEKKRGA